jgi:hypothetical protein
MKLIKLYEEYASERAFKRRRESFFNLDEESKKKFSAEFIIKKLKRKYPKEKFTIVPYYDTKAKVAFLSTDSRLLNSWNRDSDRYEDGLNKDFAKWLKSNDLDWSWHNEEGRTWWDGITISPKDFEYMKWYYCEEPLRFKTNSRIENSYLIKVIEEFKKQGLDVSEPEDDIEYNYDEGSDRICVEMIKYGMRFRFYIMKERHGGTVKNQVEEKINKYEQTMKRHFHLIKEVYDYCVTVAEGPLCTMCGGGLQLQQFYEDDNGYIAILYLDMEDDKENINHFELDQLNRVPKREYSLSVNGKKNDIKFKNFKVKGVKLSLSKNLYSQYNSFKLSGNV